MNYARLAREFGEKYPPGSFLEDAELDAFFRQSEYVGAYDPKDRARWAEKLRAAGSHPRRHQEDGPSFTLESNHKGGWHSRECLQFLADGRILDELDQFALRQQDRLRLMAEGVNLEKVLAHSRAMAHCLKLELKLQFETYSHSMRWARQSAKQLQEIQKELDQLMVQQRFLDAAIPNADEEGD